jgi:hypothetical protein
MYPIASAVVETKTKENWTWFLKTLVSDLGEHSGMLRLTFILDRQKVSYITFNPKFIFYNYCRDLMYYDFLL